MKEKGGPIASALPYFKNKEAQVQIVFFKIGETEHSVKSVLTLYILTKIKSNKVMGYPNNNLNKASQYCIKKINI